MLVEQEKMQKKNETQRSFLYNAKFGDNEKWRKHTHMTSDFS